MKNNLTFNDISLFPSIEKNRVIKRITEINAIVDWTKIENMLIKNYPAGKSAEKITENRANSTTDRSSTNNRQPRKFSIRQSKMTCPRLAMSEIRHC